MGTSPAPQRNDVAWVVVLIGLVCLVASVSELIGSYGEPEQPRPVTLQQILDGQVGPKAYVEVRDYRLCSHYVKSWNRGGRVLDDRLWCTGLVPGHTESGSSDSRRPHVIYKPSYTWAAQPFLEQFQKQGVLRGRLSKDVGLSAFEQDMIERTYPDVNRSSCLALYEDPPPRERAEMWRGVAFGGVMLTLGSMFTGPGRKARSWFRQRLVKGRPA